MRVVIRFMLVMIFFGFVSLASAEKLGNLDLDELTLRPEFLLKEGQFAQFSLENSLVGLRWRLDSNIGAHINFGSLSLLNIPAHFESSQSEEFGLVEAYGEYSGVYGRIRAGLLPLGYGVEGSRREGDLEWPRTLLFRNRVVGLRDYGFWYSTENQGFYTRLAVHNGEGQVNRDARVWVTASWGWIDVKRFNLGVSGSTGTTKPEATSISGDSLAGVDPALRAKWRMGTIYLQALSGNWNYLIEGTWGSVEQEMKRGNGFVSAHVDVGYDFSSQGSLLFRGDYFDPNDRIAEQTQREVSLAWVWKSSERNSRFYLMGTKVVEDTHNQVNNDMVRIVWHLNVQSFSQISP